MSDGDSSGMDSEGMEDVKRPAEQNCEGVINPGFLFFDKFGDEMWLICELDNSHYIKLKSMKEHLVECRKTILKSPRKTECPYNPHHIINVIQISDHIMTCPNRVVLTNTLCDFEPKRQLFEGVKMEPMNEMPIIDASWEKDEVPEASYDPMKSHRFHQILVPTPPRMSKAKRKAHRNAERLRHQQLGGETKEKPRAAPYPTRDEINARKGINKENAPNDHSKNVQSLIDGLSGAVIADPRDAALRQINQRLKIVQMLEARLNEEKLELQRQIEAYRAVIVKREGTSTTNSDPRLAPRKSSDNPDRSNESDDQTSR